MVDKHSPGSFQIAKKTRHQPREFNILSILDVSREENHVRSLSFLLNPSMPHNQQCKILNSFLNLPSLGFDSEELINIEEWQVEPEKWITHIYWR